MIELFTLVVGPLEENCYIACDANTREAIIVDPGAEAEKITRFIKKKNIHPLMIINTHGHWDHVGAVGQLKEVFDIPFYLHEDDKKWLEEPLASYFGPSAVAGVTVNRSLKDGDEITFGGHHIRVIHTPGHTQGGCVLWLMDDDIAFTGDTLFKGTVGRTDFTDGSYEDILHSVQNALKDLPAECVLYPGHGPKSTMAFERVHNPYMRYQA